MRAVNLTSKTRFVITFLHNEGYAIRKLSEKVGKAKTTVHLIIKKFMKTGSVADQLGSGRPRISTPRDDKVLIMISKKDHHKTYSELANNAQNQQEQQLRLTDNAKIAEPWST